jgi:hypothetical protein
VERKAEDFIVTRRVGGAIWAEGEVSSDGRVEFSSFLLDEVLRDRIANQISNDVKEGFSGGTLSSGDLEWLVLLRGPIA